MSPSDVIIQEMEKLKLVAVVTIPDVKIAVPLANAMLAGGVKFVEITFRNDQAKDALKALQTAKLPLLYGAGTVRSIELAKTALDAGAKFLVAPGFNDTLVKWTKNEGILFFPGVDSTLGIEKACSLGLKYLKFYPAGESGGVKWLKAVKDPYFDIKFMPTGGISLDNLKEYLELSNVFSIGGSFLAPKELIQEKKFNDITAICKKAMEIVNSLKK